MVKVVFLDLGAVMTSFDGISRDQDSSKIVEVNLVDFACVSLAVESAHAMAITKLVGAVWSTLDVLSANVPAEQLEPIRQSLHDAVNFIVHANDRMMPLLSQTMPRDE